MSASPYDGLVRLAERELELVEAGELEEALRLQAERRELTATLAAAPPAEARAALERAAELQLRVTTALAARMQAVRAELDHAGRGRQAARSYGGARPASFGSVDHAA